MKVLLADDSELIRKRLEDIVFSYGHIELVGSFNNGTEAMKALKALKPDLVILDIQMPGYTGLEILHEIRKQNKTTIFVILTLYSSGFYRQRAMKEGANYFFSKADDFDKIHSLIEEMLQQQLKDKPARYKKTDSIEI